MELPASVARRYARLAKKENVFVPVTMTEETAPFKMGGKLPTTLEKAREDAQEFLNDPKFTHTWIVTPDGKIIEL